MKSAPFAYERVESLGDAVDALVEWGPEARVLAGGQSLMPMLAMRAATPSALVDIGRIHDGGLGRDGDQTVFGATVTQTAAVDQGVALLDLALPHVGHRQTRNRGTICGSLAHADPLGELPLALLVAGAHVDLRGPAGARALSVDAFLDRANEPRRGAAEVIAAVRVERDRHDSGSGFVEVARAGATIAAAAARIDATASGSQRLRFGVAATAGRPVATEVELAPDSTGAEVDARALAEELLADVELIEDRNGDRVYRHAVAVELAVRAISMARRDRVTS